MQLEIICCCIRCSIMDIHKPSGLPRWVTPGRFVSARGISLVAILAVGLILFTLKVMPPSPTTNIVAQVAPPTFAFPTERVLNTSDIAIVDVPSLIKALREATMLASGGQEPADFTEQDRALWYQKNPCRSREQMEPLYTLRKFVKDVELNLKWKQVFKEYEKLHRACTQNIGLGGTTVEDYFLNKSNKSGCRFLVGGIALEAGLGNKILSMVSSLMYAILTQRVFLVPAGTLVPGITCEPFEGSSWLFDPEKKFTPEYEASKVKYWSPAAQFYTEVDDAKARGVDTHETYGTAIYALTANDFWCQPGARFFCDTEQGYLGHIPWIYINGCLYYLPKLFAIPSFRPVLEELFPDRMALTHLLRSSMLPSDEVWRRVEQIHSAYLKDADRRFGIQVRYRYGDDDFNRTHTLINDRVLKCALDNKILPGDGASSAPSVPQIVYNATDNLRTMAFITSLYPSLHSYLSERYVRNPPAMDDVGFIQVTHGHYQHFNEEEDKQALAEIISLSFSDYLFVTPLSTFGGTAQGYGALTPWFIDNRPNSQEACVRAQTVDTCYQIPEFKFSCPYEPKLDNEWVLATVPYLKDCLQVDAQYGIQLITTQR